MYSLICTLLVLVGLGILAFGALLVAGLFEMCNCSEDDINLDEEDEKRIDE